MLHNCRTYLKINFFLSPCRSDNTEHFYGSVNQFIFFNFHWYMHGTVAVHTCDTKIQHWLKTLFLAAFTILLCGDCLATLAFRPSTGNHYITPAAIQKYIENGITTREPPSNEPVYFKFHFTHYNGLSYNNFVQKKYIKENGTSHSNNNWHQMFSSSELYMSKRCLHNFPSLKRLSRKVNLKKWDWKTSISEQDS